MNEFENVVPLAAARRDETAPLVVEVEGFEGPLDLLLALAKTQKVDLARISILQLVEQYLAYLEELRNLRLEVAADYLVMAAWLTYLKSRLLLPEPEEDDEPSGEFLAEHLAFRLQRLEAMREATARLMNRHRLGLDMFARGMPEGVTVERVKNWDAGFFEFLQAYTEQRKRTVASHMVVRPRRAFSLKDAREMLERLIGMVVDWLPLEVLLAPYLNDLVSRQSVLASSFAASLELAREGILELRQDRMFGPLYARRPPGAEEA